MNENIPPPNPVPPPPRPEDMHPKPRPMPPRGRDSDSERGLGNVGGCMVGFVLLVLTFFLAGEAVPGPNWGTAPSVASLIVFLLGLAIASISLFFRGYRAIFLGFIIPIGVVFLLFVVICGPMVLHH